MNSLGSFSQIMYDGFTRFSVLQIMYENYYDEQLAKISTCVKYSIDVYHIYTFCRDTFSRSVSRP